jgi:hypothetical protein
LDDVSAAAGIRAVRAKVHAEASSVCKSCGRRHLLDSHCSAAADAAHGDCGERAGGHLDQLTEATPDTGTDAAVAPDDNRARRLVGSVITYLGLDPASFGEVDDGVPSPVADAGTAGGLWPEPEPEDAPQPFDGLPRLRVRRLITFLGFDVGAVHSVSSMAHDDDSVATPSTASTASSTAATDEELLPADQTAPTESPVDADADANQTATVIASDGASRHYWRRTDDDILYRPSRRPRSPRRAWRDRVAQLRVQTRVARRADGVVAYAATTGRKGAAMKRRGDRRSFNADAIRARLDEAATEMAAMADQTQRAREQQAAHPPTGEKARPVPHA